MRLRLARYRDAAALAGLLDPPGAELQAGRLVRFDARRQVVVCATSLIDCAERIVGVGAIELGSADPLLVEIDEAAGPELRLLLQEALVQRAGIASGHRAA